MSLNVVRTKRFAVVDLSDGVTSTPTPAASTTSTTVPVEESVPEGEAAMSKNALKKMLKGKDKPKKEKEVAKPKEDGEKKEKKAKKEKEPEVVFADSTPAGEKKVLSAEFPPTYQPKYVEAAWSAWWEKAGFFAPNRETALTQVDASNKFVMVIPPPNVTGSLHLGHALTTAVEDTLTRWHRMKGKVVCWVPGTDHAGIATQSVVEKRLKKEEGLTRHDLGREEFVQRVWSWKETYGNKITNQIRSLGASVDWSREAFTMDANLSRAVTEAFVRFHEDGLIYRDTRLINWSCALQSAISEIEVDYVDVEGRTFLSVPNHRLKDKYEFGTLTSFAYRVADPATGAATDDEIVVATTRLETMLGDTAVAVHPLDARYAHLHGRHVVHPFSGRLIPLVLDDVLVDMSFGTGAVKITPAHDPNDYLCGKRNDLEFIVMLTEDGKIAANGGDFAGMMRYDARIAIEAALKEKGLLRGKEDNKMRLGLCSRSGDVIEPMLTPQWYVNCNSMAERSIAAVRNGDLKIVPDFHEATWFRWLENIRDWCISRQLWWGHRIPAYFARVRGESRLDKNDPANNARWTVARTIEDARLQAAAVLGVDAAAVELEQDEDVLDTWFSSGLFPFSVFGWPNQTLDLDAFYPTTLLETGADILFFWVARMVMMGLHLTDKLPFSTVYLHAMVRDKYGRKMSKSLGNVIDPLEVIYGCSLDQLLLKIQEGNLPAKEVDKAKAGQEADFPEGIPECGADALRFGLLAYTVQGRDVNLDIKRVVGYRQFCNKLWNAVRFALTYITSDSFVPAPAMVASLASHEGLSPRDKYILSRLNETVSECNKQMEAYSFGAVTSALHSFFLYDFCDLYLELCKPVVSSSAPDGPAKSAAQMTLFTCLEHFLRLAHPLMPFVTEELWQRLPNLSSFTPVQSIMISRYPEVVAEWSSPEVEHEVELLKELIHGARSLRTEYHVGNNVKAVFYYSADSDAVREVIARHADDFCTMARGSSLTSIAAGESAPSGCSVKVISDQVSLLVDLRGLVDVDNEILRLRKEIERITPNLEQYLRKISVADYETKVPENIRTINAEKLQSYQAELAATQQAIEAFLKLKA